jgi:single-strand DNA-binding protein
MSYQKIIIAGNLGRDPELKYFDNGNAVANMSVATNRKWKDEASGEMQEETTWFKVSVWGAQAEACHEHLRKGQQVLVEGRLRPDPVTGGPRIYAKNDGFAGASFEMVASNVRFLGQNGHNGNGANGNGVPLAPGTDVGQEEDEIPF